MIRQLTDGLTPQQSAWNSNGLSQQPLADRKKWLHMYMDGCTSKRDGNIPLPIPRSIGTDDTPATVYDLTDGEYATRDDACQ